MKDVRTLKLYMGNVMRKMARYNFVRRCFRHIAEVLHKNSERFDHVAANPILPVQGKVPEKSWPPELPGWVMDEMLELSKIEPTLLLEPMGAEKKFEFYELPEYAEPGRAYAEAWKNLHRQKFTHILVAPWLVRGGADLGVLHHIDRIVAMPGTNVLLITTENADSPWATRIDPRATLLELGKICSGLDFNDTVTVLTRLILQLHANVVHIINSHAAWEMMYRCGRSIRQISKIYASLYCDEYTPDGRVTGYARHYLRACDVYLEKVISDNSVLPEIWSRELGVGLEKFAVVHFPTRFPELPPSGPHGVAKRVLWAGRFTAQKNPNLLAQIAANTPDVQYDVYGTNDPGNIEFPENVIIKGLFDDFADIPHADYGCYLNTSLWDGLPNVLLEATASGLPIVSTTVGGILDFLSHENAFLIEDVTDIDGICKKIYAVTCDHEVARNRWRCAYERLRACHSIESMRHDLMSIDGYFGV